MTPPCYTGEQPVLLHIDDNDPVAQITLNRPYCLNAINVPLLTLLVGELEKVKSSHVKVCIIQASGKHFCSGEDLKETLAPLSKGKDPEETRGSLLLLQDVTRLMTGTSVIFIACLQGWAIGGGAEIALAADMVIASSSTIFKFPEVCLGHAPTGGITARLPQLIGLQRAKKAMLLGEPIPVTSELGLRLVTEVVADPVERSREIAAKLAAYTPHSLRAVKLCTEASVFPDSASALLREFDAASLCFADPAALKAFTNFRMRKQPVPSGLHSDSDNRGVNDTLISLLQRQNSSNGDRAFLRFGAVDVTYSQFIEDVSELAAGLLSFGIRSKDVVAAMMLNSAEMMTLWFATMWIGAIWAPLNTEFKGVGLERALDVVHPKLMIVDNCFLKLIPESRLFPLLVNGNCDFQQISALRSRLRASATPSDRNATASLLFTSGTSGLSKACELSHAYFLNVAKTLVTSLQLREDDVLFCPFPLYHADATSLTVIPALLLGTTAALSQRFSASRWWAEIRQTRSTVADFMGATLSILFKAPPTSFDPDNSLRIMWGVPVPSWVEQFEERFKLRIYEVYGSTETGLPVVQDITKPRVIGSCGVAREHAVLRIVDECTDTKDVKAGVTGELLVRQPSSDMFTGYYNNPSATASSNRDGWFHTGDLCKLDEEGNLFFVSRRQFVIRRRGENVSAFEVEEILLKHGDIMECAIYGVESELTEEDVVASVVVRPGSSLTEEQVFNFALASLGRHQVPRYIEIVDTLPRSPTGKVEVHRLKAKWKEANKDVKEFILPRQGEQIVV